MADNVLQINNLRNALYRSNYPRILTAINIMILINLLLVVVVFYQASRIHIPKYFASTTDNRNIRLQSLNQPLIPPTKLLDWANRVAVSAFTFNFVNYNQALSQLKNSFTQSGWSFFQEALKSSKTLETVLDKKLVVSAVSTGAPVILKQDIIHGRYSWKVQMPLLITYQSPSDQTQQSVVITMVVSRVPTTITSRGIAIESFVASVRGAA